MSWSTVKIKYQEEQQSGSLKTIVETYLIEALSFSDAEARTYELLKDVINENYTIMSIGNVRVSDIFESDIAEKWFQAKIVYTSIDEIKKVEKRIVLNVFVQADNILQVYERIILEFKNMLIPYEIEGIKLTPILEVYKQNPQSVGK